MFIIKLNYPLDISRICDMQRALIRPEFAYLPIRVKVTYGTSHTSMLVYSDGRVSTSCRCHIPMLKDGKIIGVRISITGKIISQVEKRINFWMDRGYIYILKIREKAIV